MNARHSLDSVEWYTPTHIIDAARHALGEIDLDPASHEEANARIRAKRFYSADDNGLEQPWFGKVFINPPGGLVREFWQKLIHEYTEGRVTAAVWVGYSLEQLQTLQSELVNPLSFPFCVPKRRIAFIESEARAALRRLRSAERGRPVANAPSHGNYISYLGDYEGQFEDAFAGTGMVVIPEWFRSDRPARRDAACASR